MQPALKHLEIALMCCAPMATALFGQPSVLTWHNDNQRTGQNLQETILTPSNVNVLTFGKLFVIAVDGKVDAQPLYVPAVTIPAQGSRNVLYVATEHDSVYAFNADTGALLWHVSLLASGETPSDDHGCSQVTPEIGATATPAIDPQVGPHGTIYAVGTTKDSGGKYHHRLHALDITTGAEQFSGPVDVQATYSGSGAENTFNPTVHKERPGLLILNGVVYTSWSSHCDFSSYAGWLIGYNETTLQQTGVLNLVPNGNDGALWNSGSGPAADSSGNIYALTGNGTFDTSLDVNGFPNKGDFGNAFVKAATTGGPLRVVDYFTMSNTTSESNQDVDLGSGGALLLPPLNDALGHARDLAVGAGKDGHIYVVDRSNLGKFNSSSNVIYQDMPNALPGGVWSSPAWFNGKLYYGDVGGTLKAFTFANGAFGTVPFSHSGSTFPYPGTTPSISANGTSNAIVWAAENGGTAVLHAYNGNDLSQELYNSNQAANNRDHFGTGNKFIVPTVVNGKVYVGTTNGVGVFGLIAGAGSVSVVSVTPNSGGGTTQTFQFQYADTNGAPDIVAVEAWFTPSTSTPANSCLIYFATGSQLLYLLKDDASAWNSQQIGTVGTLSNGQCSINVANVMVSTNGNNLTLSVPYTFTPGFAGLKQVLMYATGNTNNSGWQVVGSWTTASATVSAVSVTPNSGSGLTQTFQFKAADTGGFEDIQALEGWITPAVATANNTCLIYYATQSQLIYLYKDDGSGWISQKIGTAGTLQNSQCTLNAGSTTVSGVGNNLTLSIPIMFAGAFAGAKQMFLYAVGTTGNSGWQVMGSWTPAPSTVSITSVTPNAGSGSTQTFQFKASDTGGAPDIQAIQGWFTANTSNPANSCLMYFATATQLLFLLKDDASGWTSQQIGTAGTLQNTQCSLNVGGTTAVSAGTMLTLSVPVTFKSPAFSGAKQILMWAQGTNNNTEFQNEGNWMVP